ncbi:DUF1735 domain-containing protein [Bacteroides thetaiotaomicron]|nr:DUF1735 domain-containing protein [Bacteroides thetaiotaomicron]
MDNYNSANSTYYIPLPSDFYTLPDVTIAKGKTTGGSAISLLGETLPPEIIFFRFHSADLADKETPAST